MFADTLARARKEPPTFLQNAQWAASVLSTTASLALKLGQYAGYFDESYAATLGDFSSAFTLAITAARYYDTQQLCIQDGVEPGAVVIEEQGATHSLAEDTVNCATSYAKLVDPGGVGKLLGIASIAKSAVLNVNKVAAGYLQWLRLQNVTRRNGEDYARFDVQLARKIDKMRPPNKRPRPKKSDSLNN